MGGKKGRGGWLRQVTVATVDPVLGQCIAVGLDPIDLGYASFHFITCMFMLVTAVGLLMFI
jgi:hypothetical protein